MPKGFDFHRPMKLPPEVFIGGIPEGYTNKAPAHFAVAIVNSQTRVFEFNDSEEDLASLRSLIQSGDLIELIYGHRVAFVNQSVPTISWK